MTRALRAGPGPAAARGPAHLRLPLNEGWRFGGRSHPDAIAPAADDAAFERIALPHCVAPLSWSQWNAAQWDGRWIYRRHFRPPPAFAGRRVFLAFEGALTVATPCLNGHPLPVHRGGYLPFRREITEWVQEGDNVLVLGVDSRWSNVPPEGAPRGRASIDFFEPGGIIRPAWIEAVPQVYISDVFAKPVDVLTRDRRLDVTCTLDASTVPDAAATVAVELREGERVLARAERPAPITAPGVGEVSLHLAVPPEAALWDIDSPRLYDLVTCLTIGSSVVHEHRTRVGLRDARFHLDGFYLNGRRRQLFGLNRHELFPYAGFAMPPRVLRKDAEILRRELNCNAVRCSHYPQSEAFLDACDELGLLVWEEMPGWHYIGDSVWQDLAVQDVQAMVRRDRNRPSIVIWGVRVNESANDPAFYRRTSLAAKALDDSRPVSGAMNGPLHHLRDWAEDVFAYNDYHHPGPAGRPQLLPPLPGVPYLITEAVGQIVGPGPGSGHMYRRVADPAVQMRQALYHAEVHSQAAGNPRYAGVLAWCAFDYASPMNSYEGVKCPGVCDPFRLPKLGASFYRAQVDPAIRPVIEPNFHWNFGPHAPRGPGRDVAIFSNCTRLDVFIAGEHHATLEPDRTRYPHLLAPPFFVDLDLDGAGSPELRIDGYVGERRVLTRRFSSDPAHDRLALHADDPEIRAGGSDGTRVVFQVVDQHGAPRAFARGDVVFELSGPARLVGDNPFQGDATGGSGAVWVRSTEEAGGTVTVTATHSRLGRSAVTLFVRGSNPGGHPGHDAPLA